MKTIIKLFLSFLLLGGSLSCFAQKSDLKEYVANIPEGRNIVIQPHFLNKNHVTGKIAIDFVVDKKGNVISATANDKGTTATDKAFVHQCEKAVMAAKFSELKNGSETQKGSVSFAY
jgi:hypothetical protein